MKTDILIVGSGCSGLYAVLNLPDELDIMLITKSDFESSDSFLAQGGTDRGFCERDCPEGGLADTEGRTGTDPQDRECPEKGRGKDCGAGRENCFDRCGMCKAGSGCELCKVRRTDETAE